MFFLKKYPKAINAKNMRILWDVICNAERVQ
jgi:hypothetical protein